MGTPILRGYIQQGAVGPIDAAAWSVDVSLPGGTQVGDGVILVVVKSYLRPEGVITVTDGRFTNIHEGPNGSVYVGTAATLSAVTVNLSNFPAPDYYNEAQAFTFSFYGPADDRPTIQTFTGGQTVVAPAHSASGGGGAFALVMGDRPAIGTWAGFTDYTTITSGGGGDWAGFGYRTDTGSPPEETTSWGGTTTADTAGMVSIVFTLWPVRGAPPCRLFPRSDGLGVGAGRHFPPPKSQQRSGRRFGYY